ncbi:MAG: helix-turn-helix domain-containing protein [Clostridia bacterium]|nr:helix-turn-helix domain-containing protein [Clostridia bacterium]
MEYRHELINFGERVPVRCFIHQLGHSGRHWHDSLELLFVLSGSVSIVVDGEKYVLDEEDVILINANEPHELSASHGILAAVQIKLSLFDPELLPEEPLYFDCNSTTSTNHEGIVHIKRIVAQFVRTYAEGGESRLYRAKALSYALLSELITYFKSERSETRQLQARQQNERITRIVNYIGEHYREGITLQQVAEQEYLSMPYLSRFFNKMMGMGFTAYLSQVRLTQAVTDLLTTERHIDRIASDNGFPNTQSFVQLFKKQYGVLPSQYRRTKAQENDAPAEVVSNEYDILDTTQYLEYFSRYLEGEGMNFISAQTLPDIVSHYSADISEKAIPLRHTWRTFTSVGSAKELLQADVQRMLTELQKDVGFTYIKFHGLLSDDMHVCVQAKDGKIVYSFVYVDMALDFLLSIGLKPMIQLGFMPAAIAQDAEHRIFHSTMINSVPVSMEAWCDLVRSFTEHVLARYGADTVEQWPFTVWNEPDTPTTMFGFEREEDFFLLYRETYQTVKQLDGRIRVGTPSIYYSEDTGRWCRNFAARCRQYGIAPDFFLFHFYGTVLFKNREVYIPDLTINTLHLSTDENMLSKSIDVVQSLAGELYGKKIPLYLTEWTLSPSHRELLGDTCYRSCYLVKNILENIDRLDAMGYWVLTDLFVEHQVPPDTFHGGLGLYTYNGIRKPVYYAMWLLGKLGSELVGRGDGWFLTRKGNSYQLMLYHYRHYSDLYAACEAFDMTYTNRYTPFGPEQRREFEIRIEQMPEGNWHALEYSISRSSGSAFDKWVEMGAQPLENREEVTLLQSLSQPMINKYTLHTSANALTVNAILDLLEVKLILLSR